MRKFVLFLIAVVTVGAGCGDNSPGSSNIVTAPTALNVSGTWTGTATDLTGPAQVTLVLTQTGNAIAGTSTASYSGIVVTGVIAGTLSGTTATMVETINPGGISSAPSCSGTLSLVATDITASQMTGTYSGGVVCAVSFADGRFTLTRSS